MRDCFISGLPTLKFSFDQGHMLNKRFILLEVLLPTFEIKTYKQQSNNHRYNILELIFLPEDGKLESLTIYRYAEINSGCILVSILHITKSNISKYNRYHKKQIFKRKTWNAETLKEFLQNRGDFNCEYYMSWNNCQEGIRYQMIKQVITLNLLNYLERNFHKNYVHTT